MTAVATAALVGAWRLAAIEPAADCTGQFVFTADGRFSVQVMYRDAHSGSAYARDGYEATFGRYEIDDRAHRFTLHVEGALVRSLIGKDLLRVYEFSGNRLVVRSANPEERWRVTWER